LLRRRAPFPATQAQKLPYGTGDRDRFVKASGGAEALQSIKSMRAKGTFSIVGQSLNGTLDMMSARPNKLLMRLSIPPLARLKRASTARSAGPSIRCRALRL
jgi:hypothetical protein